MPNKWCVLFYWLLVCLDIPGEFVYFGGRFKIIFHIEDQFVGFVIYHSSALRNSFIDLAACSARGLLLHVV